MNAPFYTASSPIHGWGLFANQYYPYGAILFKACDLSGNVTKVAKWVNHSKNANIGLHKESSSASFKGGSGWYAVAIKPIFQGQEIVANYNANPPVLEGPEPGWDSAKLI